jgi:hypothetical protein
MREKTNQIKYEKEKREIEQRKARTREALRKLQKVARAR